MSATIQPAPIRKSVRVKAAPPRAFEIFTSGMGRWWLKTHSISPTKTPIKDVVLEPRAGGRWFERGEDGSECEWGKVLAWEPPHRVLLAWQINADWRYDPALVTEVEVLFTVLSPGTTRVDLEHRCLERLGERAGVLRAAFDSTDGWQGCLAALAEFVIAGV